MAQATYSADSTPVTGTRSGLFRAAMNFLRTYPYLIPAILFFVGWADSAHLRRTTSKFH